MPKQTETRNYELRTEKNVNITTLTIKQTSNLELHVEDNPQSLLPSSFTTKRAARITKTEN